MVLSIYDHCTGTTFSYLTALFSQKSVQDGCGAYQAVTPLHRHILQLLFRLLYIVQAASAFSYAVTSCKFYGTSQCPCRNFSADLQAKCPEMLSRNLVGLISSRISCAVFSYRIFCNLHALQCFFCLCAAVWNRSCNSKSNTHIFDHSMPDRFTLLTTLQLIVAISMAFLIEYLI